MCFTTTTRLRMRSPQLFLICADLLELNFESSNQNSDIFYTVLFFRVSKDVVGKKPVQTENQVSVVMASNCDGCAVTEYEAISRFFKKNDESVQFFRDHGVLPKKVKCPKCGKDCVLRSPWWCC